MPGRSIGAVYVTVLANTKAFEREVKDAARNAGGDASKEYSKEFNKAFADIEKSKEFDQAAAKISKDFHDLGKKSGTSWEQGFKDVRISEAADADIKRIAQRFNMSSHDVAKEVAARLSGAYDQVANDADRAMKAVTQSVERETDKSGNRIMTAIDKRLKKIQLSLRRAGSGGFFAGLTSVLGAFVGLANTAVQAVGGIVTGLVGMFKFGEKAATSVADAGEAVVGLGSAATEAGGESAMAGLAGSVEAVASGGASLIPVVIAAGVVIGTLGVGAAIAAAAVSALAGILVIAASGIATALGGVLAFAPLIAALVAGLLAMVLALKPVIKPLMDFNKVLDQADPKKRAKALKVFNDELSLLPKPLQDVVKSLEPFVEHLKTIGDLVSQSFFTSLGSSLSGLDPLLQVAGDGLAQIASALGTAVGDLVTLLGQNDNLKVFSDLWSGLATLIQPLFGAIGNFVLGIEGLLVALTPAAQTLAGWLLQITGSFATWTTSASGQNTIKDFMDTAGEAAGHVMGALSALGSAFAILFGPNGAQGDGQDFLATIETLAQKFRDWIAEVSQNGQLQSWLDFAKEAANRVGTAIGIVAKIFDDLDTGGTRQAFLWLLDILNAVLVAIDLIAQGIAAFTGLQVSTVHMLADAFDAVASAVQSIIDKVSSLIGAISRIHFPSAPSWASGLTNLGKGIFGAHGGVFTSPTIIGEAGAELAIPLTGSLGSVDPSVRAAAAMIRGESTSTSGAVALGRQTTQTVNVYPVAADPMAVAVAVLNRAAAAARV